MKKYVRLTNASFKTPEWHVAVVRLTDGFDPDKAQIVGKGAAGPALVPWDAGEIVMAWPSRLEWATAEKSEDRRWMRAMDAAEEVVAAWDRCEQAEADDATVEIAACKVADYAAEAVKDGGDVLAAVNGAMIAYRTRCDFYGDEHGVCEYMARVAEGQERIFAAAVVVLEKDCESRARLSRAIADAAPSILAADTTATAKP